jgi:hypothetical protein
MSMEMPSFESCPCGLGSFESSLVDIAMMVAGARVVLENIPQGLCPKCGSRVYSPECLLRIERLYRADRLAQPALETEGATHE